MGAGALSNIPSMEPDFRKNGYTPAAGYHGLTALYDLGIGVLTREVQWRSALVEQICPRPGDVIVDIGCGTGTLLINLHQAEPGTKLVGIDPDASILRRARKKADAAGAPVTLLRGFAHDVDTLLEPYRITKMVSSLAFHHMPMREKVSGLTAMYAVLGPGAELHISDYGLQRSVVMRALFRVSVQSLDGCATTEPNARGILPELMTEVGFKDVEETAVIRTLTGSISIYRGLRP